VDIGPITEEISPTRLIKGLNYPAPQVLAAMKAVAIASRGKKPKGLTDRVDLIRLLDGPTTYKAALEKLLEWGFNTRHPEAFALLEAENAERDGEDD